jgi:hypothetical protein
MLHFSSVCFCLRIQCSAGVDYDDLCSNFKQKCDDLVHKMKNTISEKTLLEVEEFEKVILKSQKKTILFA